MTDINPYWDERTLIIYGLLAGYTMLDPAEISSNINSLTNVQGNVLFCLNLLVVLEQAQKVKATSIWLNLHKYRKQLEGETRSDDPLPDENTERIGKVQDIIDGELDASEVPVDSFAKLLERNELATESLHGCITFEVRARGKKWLRGMVQSYLELYRQNKLFSPTAGAYVTYHQQYVALTDYLDTPKPPQKVSRYLLPNKVRLLEILYGLVDKDKLKIIRFSELTKPGAIQDQMFNVDIKVDRDIVDEKRLAVNGLNVEPHNYDAANGVLTIAGERIEIIRQKNKKGAAESKQARLMRLLFTNYTFPDPVPFKDIYKGEYIDIRKKTHSRSVLKKAGQLVARINGLVQEKLELEDLIKMDEYNFSINKDYLKKRH